MTETGQLIKKTRMERGFSQAELAKYLKVSAAFINRIESGKVRWSLDRTSEICRALRMKKEIFVYAATKDFERKIK